VQRLLNISEVSRILGCHRVTLKRWIRGGKGPRATISPGGRYMFREADIADWQESLRASQPLNLNG
jgi:excisionase family DNA binding protein